MKKINILVATAVAGAFLSGCAEFKLPELPKTEKQKSQKELTKADCEKILKKERESDINQSDARKKLLADAQYCRMHVLNEAKSAEELLKMTE